MRATGQRAGYGTGQGPVRRESYMTTRSGVHSPYARFEFPPRVCVELRSRVRPLCAAMWGYWCRFVLEFGAVRCAYLQYSTKLNPSASAHCSFVRFAALAGEEILSLVRLPVPPLQPMKTNATHSTTLGVPSDTVKKVSDFDNLRLGRSLSAHPRRSGMMRLTRLVIYSNRLAFTASLY